MTKKVQMLGLALLSLCALSALMAASASAVLTYELALWLLNGADVTGAVLVDAIGELLLLNLLNLADLLCSGLFEGTVEPESLDLVTMVYDLSLIQNLIEELVGTPIECASDNICDANSGLVWPVNLPWLTEVEQDSVDGSFWELTFGAGWHLDCTVFGILAEELCELVEGENEILNVTGGIEAVEETNEMKPEAKCNEVELEGEVVFIAGNLTSAVGGGTLTVSLP
jgi:hypothetical protein